MDGEELKRNGAVICDETFAVKVSRDGMQVVLAPKKEDATLPAHDVLRQELAGLGITEGLLAHPVSQPDKSFLVARGRPPVNGENARARLHVKPSVVRAPKVTNPEKGDKVDYRELGNIVNVKAGQLLIEKIALTEGTPGSDVFGNEVASKPGRDLKLKIGSNIRFEEEENKLYAATHGKFIMADEKASVLDEHGIREDVDLTTGNVTFGGKRLSVQGAVLPGFRVKCRGEVYIGKGVNNAEILAGGNITILGGIIGEQALITGMGNITTDFVENGPKIKAPGSMLLKDVAIQAEVEIGGSLRAVEGKGLVVGGKYVIGGSMWVRELGSEGEVITEVTVGIKPELEQKKEKLRRDQEVWPARMSETLKNINGLGKLKKEAGGKLDPEKQQLLDKYNAFLPKVMEKVNHLTELEEQINAEIAKSANECIYVYGQLHPGVKIHIGNAVRVVSNQEKRVVVRLNPSTLQITIQPMIADELTMFNQ